MTIGLLEIDLLIPGAHSLKEKRRVIKSLKERMRGRFNCSVAEVAYQDVWTRARLAVCVVSESSRHANDQLNSIAQYAANDAGAAMVDYRIELL
ncbi:MAG: DUF503 domain-containing protein [Candidatus Hydrogenedentes bacterium]|nr:DUF503 domain-containing protein [Candidatus Hydrogenedentota bacterium]